MFKILCEISYFTLELFNFVLFLYALCHFSIINFVTENHSRKGAVSLEDILSCERK